MSNDILMTINPEDLMRRVNRELIGWDKTFTKFFGNTPLNPSNYPPHNVEKVSDDQYQLTVAIAGFTKDDVTLIVENGILQIQGKQDDLDDSDYLYVGIAARDFNLKIGLGEYVKVSEAKLKDGLLILDLKREVPEAMKPKTITIK